VIPPLLPTATADEIKAIDEALEKDEEYLTKEGKVTNIILTSVPESTQIRILPILTSSKMWEAVCDEYENCFPFS